MDIFEYFSNQENRLREVLMEYKVLSDHEKATELGKDQFRVFQDLYKKYLDTASEINRLEKLNIENH